MWHDLANSKTSDRTTKLKTLPTCERCKLYPGTFLQFGTTPGTHKDWSDMQYVLAPGHRDLSAGALENLLTFGLNNQAEAE